MKMNEKQAQLIRRYQIAEFDELNILRAPDFDKANRKELKKQVREYLKESFLDGYSGVHFLLDVGLISIGLSALITKSVMKKTAGKTFADRIDSLPDGFSDYELERIVTTEGHRVYVDGQEDAADAIQNHTDALIYKRWDATMDLRTRPTHALLNGQIKWLDEPFVTIHGSAQAPGKFGVAEEDINCRCILSFEKY